MTLTTRKSSLVVVSMPEEASLPKPCFSRSSSENLCHRGEEICSDPEVNVQPSRFMHLSENFKSRFKKRRKRES